MYPRMSHMWGRKKKQQQTLVYIYVSHKKFQTECKPYISEHTCGNNMNSLEQQFLNTL